MCGKDQFIHFFINLIQGSPPHVRERPRQKRKPHFRAGITPACAGKTGRAIS